VQYLAHSASFHSDDEIAPSKLGIKHLARCATAPTIKPSVSITISRLWPLILFPHQSHADPHHQQTVDRTQDTNVSPVGASTHKRQTLLRPLRNPISLKPRDGYKDMEREAFSQHRDSGVLSDGFEGRKSIGLLQH